MSESQPDLAPLVLSADAVAAGPLRMRIWDLWSKLVAAVESLPLENAGREELLTAVCDLSDLIGDAVGPAGELDRFS